MGEQIGGLKCAVRRPGRLSQGAIMMSATLGMSRVGEKGCWRGIWEVMRLIVGGEKAGSEDGDQGKIQRDVSEALGGSDQVRNEAGI